MNYSCACLGVVATLTLAGCSLENPLFGLLSASDATDAGAESTSVTPTGDPSTSTTRPATDGFETDVTGTQTATSVDPETGGTSSSGSGGPGSESESDSGAVGCGNGMLDSDLEKCDDGNQIDGDDCTNMCTLPVCGDGSLHDEEECDDGNNLPDDGCDPDCTKGVNLCGNGFLDPNEQCDDGAGNNGPGKACLGTCQKNICGDADQGPDEECDLGPANLDTGLCTPQCKDPFCGDGFTNGNETCDDGQLNGQELGLCNEVCSGNVPKDMLKIIVLPLVTGDFNGSPGIAGGDVQCNKALLGAKIMASDGKTRVASLGENTGDGQVDWVLAAHQGYMNANGAQVFITGSERLIGVHKQVAAALSNPIGEAFGTPVWTGMKTSYQSAVSNCTKWTTTDNLVVGITGDAGSTGPLFIGGAPKSCGSVQAIYCVQQPQ